MVDQMEGMPKGIQLLVKQAAKQIPEETIDDTIKGVLDFLASAFIQLEDIMKDDDCIVIETTATEIKQLQA